MADLVTPLVAASATVIAAIGGPMVTGSLQNRRDSQLRIALKENTALRKELRESGVGTSREAELDQLIDRQIAALITRDQKRLDARREWSNLGVSLFLLFALGWIPVLMWPFNRWWDWVLGLPVAIFVAVFCTVGLILTFKPDAGKRKTKAPRAKKGRLGDPAARG